jgi:hypothetical protein
VAEPRSTYVEVTGRLEFHSETGTEGGYWAVFDTRFSHRQGEPCFTGARNCWAYHPANPSGEHAGYEGLLVLRNGDELTIYEPDGEAVEWAGVIDLIQHPLFTEDANGMWIHADQRGVARSRWAEWFFDERPCALRRPPASREGGELRG